MGAVARLHAQAFERAAALYRRETPDAVIARASLQLEAAARETWRRFDKLAAWEGFAPDALRRLSPEATAAVLGEPVSAGALAVNDGLVVDPAAVLAAWLGDVRHVRGHAGALEQTGDGWRVLSGDGAVLAQADVVCLAAGAPSVNLLPLAMRPVRGQASWTTHPFAGVAAAWGGYAIPTPDGGFLFGATHKRDDWDVRVREEESLANLEALAQGRPRLASGLRPDDLFARASLRAATPDHLPLAGAITARPGLHLLTGLGGRGFTLAPLLAEEVAAGVMGAARPLPRALAGLVDPGRTSAGFQKLSSGGELLGDPT